MLGPPGKLDCLMLSTPTRKTAKSKTTLFFFISLFTLVQTIVVLNIYPHLQYWQIAANATIVLICWFTLFLSVVRNPGYLKLN